MSGCAAESSMPNKQARMKGFSRMRICRVAALGLTNLVQHLVVLLMMATVGIISTPAQVVRGAFNSSHEQLNESVTFNRDIAPILHYRCASCHHPGGAGPFSLLTYEDARMRATQIVSATSRRYMPPWKPEPGYGEFAGERRLADDEVARIKQWAESGRIEGDPKDLASAPRWTSAWQLGVPDLVVSMPEPYLLAADGPDIFRTFVIPISLQTRRYVRAFEFNPGNLRVAHHANLKIDRTPSSRSLDEDDLEPGYEGAGGLGAGFPDGHFLGWTPGQSPREAEGLAWRLDPGSDLVIELHLVPTGKSEWLQANIGLYFTEVRPTALPYMIRLGRQDIDIPSGESAYVSTDSYVLPVDVEVLAVQPHAHRLAKEVRGFATFPDGTTQWLIYIKDWDINWQDVYRFRQPLSLPRGSRVTMQYTYDNSTRNLRNPNQPPKRVTYGQTTSSEMGDLWIQVMPGSNAERELLNRDFAPKMLREDIAGVEQMLKMEPNDARIHADLGFCYLEAGRVAEALVQLEEAARLEPTSAGRQYDLGIVLLRGRNFGAAREHFLEAVRSKPDFSEAYNNLGIVSQEEGNIADAIRWYSRAVQADQSSTVATYNLGRALASRGEAEAAIERFRQVLRLDPEDAVTHSSLAKVFATTHQLDAAVLHYRRALEFDPNQLAALADLAWILANSDRTDIRAPTEAVKLAERVAALTQYQNAVVLDTLSVAYAADGQLNRAIEAGEKALQLAPGPEASAGIRERLDRYRQEVGTQKRR